jgi:hypothetical protein
MIALAQGGPVDNATPRLLVMAENYNLAIVTGCPLKDHHQQ